MPAFQLHLFCNRVHIFCEMWQQLVSFSLATDRGGATGGQGRRMLPLRFSEKGKIRRLWVLSCVGVKSSFSFILSKEIHALRGLLLRCKHLKGISFTKRLFPLDPLRYLCPLWQFTLALPVATDIHQRSQISYTTQCNGIVSHGTQFGGSLVFRGPHTKTNAKQMHLGSCVPCGIVRLFDLITRKPGRPPILALYQDKDGAGSGISGIYLWDLPNQWHHIHSQVGIEFTWKGYFQLNIALQSYWSLVIFFFRPLSNDVQKKIQTAM